MSEHNYCKNRKSECVEEKVYGSWKKNRRKQGNDPDYWFYGESNLKGPIKKMLNKDAVNKLRSKNSE